MIFKNIQGGQCPYLLKYKAWIKLSLESSRLISILGIILKLFLKDLFILGDFFPCKVQVGLSKYPNAHRNLTPASIIFSSFPLGRKTQDWFFSRVFNGLVECMARRFGPAIKEVMCFFGSLPWKCSHHYAKIL